MKAILDYIAARTREYEGHALYRSLVDETVPAEQRLKFVPCLAHFIMSFADLYALVLRHEPPPDRYQELVNAHTYEDGGHWKWFLADLKTLGLDPSLRFTDSLRFVWGESTAKTRMLTYHMCRLGLGASSLEKLVLVHCIEAGGKVALTSCVPAATVAARRLARDLLYFGVHHLDTELQHTLEDEAVHESLEEVVIEPELRPALLALVDQAFHAFDEFADGVLAFNSGPEQPLFGAAGLP